MRSFRTAIARRVTLTVGALFVAVAAASVVVIRALLIEQLDATLLRVAELEAKLGGEPGGPGFRFTESLSFSGPAGSLPEVTRYAEVWHRDGTPVIRSSSLEADLPLPAGALAEAGTGRVIWSTLRLADGAPVRSLLYPLRPIGEAHGEHVLQVAAPLAPIDQTVRKFALLMGSLATGVMAVAYLMGWREAQNVLRPMGEITDQAAALGAASLSARITAHAQVMEFKSLVMVLNEMLARLERAFQSQRRFTADASHELRAPLNVLRGEVDVALKRPRTDAEYRDVLQRCREEVIRLTRLSADLLTLARADAGTPADQLEPLDLYDVAASAVERYQPVASRRGLRIRIEGRSAVVRGSSELLDRAIANLVDNAVKYANVPGEVLVSVADGETASVQVRDTGPGIAPRHLSQLFERFFRADPARPREEGSGLGLAIARAAAEAHGGTLTFEGNAPGGGAVFRLRIPAGPAMRIDRNPVVAAEAAR
jgi:two-component system OmpR family sensor kinase